MIRIVLPDDAKERKLPFYLAMEEWIAHNLPADEYFYSWTVNPAVIIGRNQDLDCEVDREYCSKHNIDIYRRKSGGGCVYTDQDNIMISYVSPGEDVNKAFARFASLLLKVLLELDLDATRSERNDVLVAGRKVSGCAFYRLPGKSIVHSTLLFDTNMEHMLNAITPDRSKLQSHQVKSVSQRITTIKEHLPYMQIGTFVNFINFMLTDNEKTLSADEIAQIEAIEQGYYNPDFINGVHRSASKQANVHASGHFTPVVSLHDGKIASVDLVGDFFTIEDMSKMLDCLKGIACDKEAIMQALGSTDVSKTILNLDNEALAEMIANAKS